MATPTQGPPKSLGMEPNLTAALCYAPLCCIPLVVSVLVAVTDKENRFVRFHAFQSLLLWAVGTALCLGLWVVSILLAFVSGVLGTLMTFLLGLLGLGFFGLDVFLAIKAYGNEEFELPTLAEMARKWV